jgi:hypothetical protein
VKLTAALIFVIIWFLYLAIGAGAGFAAWRIWPAHKDRFTQCLILFLHGPIADALTAIVLVFLAKGVKFTWKFSIVLFAGALIKIAVSLPLLLKLMRGFTDGENSRGTN